MGNHEDGVMESAWKHIFLRSYLTQKAKIRKQTSCGRLRIEGTHPSAKRGTLLFWAAIRKATLHSNGRGACHRTTSRLLPGSQHAQPPNDPTRPARCDSAPKEARRSLRIKTMFTARRTVEAT
eukprot:5215453-Pleurochrysis_carterae.AAC.2